MRKQCREGKKDKNMEEILRDMNDIMGRSNVFYFISFRRKGDIVRAEAIFKDDVSEYFKELVALFRLRKLNKSLKNKIRNK